VQLRLVITQATAPTPQYQSLREYSEALAFFERPERSTVLQSLASRVAAAAQAAPLDLPLTLDSVAPLPESPRAGKDEPRKSTSAAPRQRSRAWGFALVAVVVLAAAGGAAWYAYKHGIGPKNKAEASALADRASDKVGAAILQGASVVSETLGLGRIVPATEVDPPAPQPAPSAPVSVPQLRRRETTPAGAVSAIVAFDLDPRIPEAGGPSPEPESVTLPSTPPVAPVDVDRTIYSVETPSVVPPIGRSPQLARQLPPDFDPRRLGRVELIISSDGSVESAKLLGPPRTVNDGLFLSVAKAWTFSPALKNGVPVRYRKTIWVASP
jgi:hypothetical protein